MIDIKLYGPVDADVANRIKAELSSANGKPVQLRVDSPGGSVWAGFSIWEAFSSYEGEKSCLVEAAAFSIASFILTAFDKDKVTLAKNAYVMVHNPYVSTTGDSDQLAKDAALLAKLKATMVEVYSERTGLTPDQVIEMLNAETYLDSAESIQYGFASQTTGESVKSRISNFDMPQVVCQALTLEASAGGNETDDHEGIQMSDSQIAATPAQIREAYPAKAEDAAFILACVEAEYTMEAVKEAFMNDTAAAAAARIEALMLENAALKAELNDIKNEDEPKDEEPAEEVEPSDEEPKEEEPSDEEEPKEEPKDEEPSDEPKDEPKDEVGNDPVALGNAPAERSNTEKWNTAIQAEVEAGKTRMQATLAVNAQNPGLRESMLQEFAK